jgi:DNA-directed RNA polymerase I subunit RPA1
LYETVRQVSSGNRKSSAIATEEGTDDEEESASSNSDDDHPKNVSSSSAKKTSTTAGKDSPDKYFTPMEVEAQMQLLWRRQSEILNFIWLRCCSESVGFRRAISTEELKTAEAWKLFFMRIILMPPNKFRPAAVVADRVSEHPQNQYLRKILEENSKLRLLQYNQTEAMKIDAEEADEQNDTSGKSSSSAATTGEHLSKIVTSLIALQTSVNSYMDSSKDVRPEGNNASGSIGVRQLLEKKEGLFRRNMMGKRVNYCCRSVISPDNNLGTNEVGIPVRFAKELHYPMPVNDFNLSYLRKLVERGPESYPGKSLS